MGADKGENSSNTFYQQHGGAFRFNTLADGGDETLVDVDGGLQCIDEELLIHALFEGEHLLQANMFIHQLAAQLEQIDTQCFDPIVVEFPNQVNDLG